MFSRGGERRFGRILASWLCALAVPPWSVIAGALPGEESVRTRARALADQAADSYAAGDYARADVLLARAYGMVPAPTVALLRARALVRLGRWVDALGVYRSAAEARLAADAPDAFRRAAHDAGQELAALTARVPRLKVTVPRTLLGDPSLAVRLDGRPLSSDQLGEWILVDPRRHTLELEIAGTTVSSESISIGPSQASLFLLEPPAPDHGSAARALGIAGLVAGGAALGLGMAAGVVAVNAHEDAKRGCPEGACTPGSAGAADLERFRKYRTLSTVGYAFGVVGVAAGAIVLLATPGEPRAKVALVASLEGLGLEGSW